MISVGPPDELKIPVATTEESGVHHSHRFGFWISGEETRDLGVPPERRPLTRRGVRSWTIGSLIGSALFAAVVAVALSRSDARDATTLSAQTRPDDVPAQAAAAPPATRPRIAIVRLEDLPIAKDGPPRAARAAPKKSTHKAVASIAHKTSTTTPVESPSRALGPSRAKAIAANGKSAAR